VFKFIGAKANIKNIDIYRLAVGEPPDDALAGRDCSVRQRALTDHLQDAIRKPLAPCG
jgi:hypothetical protein